MSGINGDKARFHRRRKDKIARRARKRELFGTVAGQSKSFAPTTGAKPKVKSA